MVDTPRHRAGGRLLAFALCLTFFSGCGQKGADGSLGEPVSGGSVSGGRHFAYTGCYEKILGGAVALRSSLTAQAEIAGLHMSPDEELSFSRGGMGEAPENRPAYPVVADSPYESDDLPLYTMNVMKMGAKADGVTDDTAVIQRALNQTGTFGGGTVYLPAGTYCIKGTLRVPEMVTLRGDFRGPDDDQAPGTGTVLLAYEGRGDENGKPFITLSMSAAVIGLTVFYPEQTAGNPTPYPPTVSGNHGKSNYSADSQTVKNCWFVNSWFMVDLQAARYTGLHWLRNIYGTPLKTGIAVDNCTDVGRTEGVYLGPQYWLKAQEIGIAPAAGDEENNRMFRHVQDNAVGLVLYRSDWEYIYNFNADCLYAGISFPKMSKQSANVQISHCTLYRCTTGMDLTVISQISSTVSNSTIIASPEENAAAVRAPKGSRNPVLFNNCRLEGGGGPAVSLEGSAALEFVNCVFTSDSSSAYAVEVTGSGSLYLEQCGFENQTRHVSVGKDAVTAHMLGCTFPDESDIHLDKSTGLKVTVDHTPLNLPVQSGLAHTYKKTLPQPASRHVYYMLDYGARTNEDCTAALKAALADAAETGGTVYFPGGRYILTESVTVPTGVELRGCAAAVFSPKDLLGTVLVAETAKGEDQTALIRLEAGAGVSGFSVFYPDQAITADTAVPYPWTIQGLGEGVWAKNICLINAYKGIDFGTYSSQNHYVQYINGSPLKAGVYLGNNAGNGWVENVHFNPHYWRDTKKYEAASTSPSDLAAYMMEHLEALVFGYNEAEHVLGTFVYAANKGVVLRAQNGRGFNGLIIGHGTDSGDRGVAVEQCDTAEFVNPILVVIDHAKEIRYLEIMPSNTGEVRVFNAQYFGQHKDSTNSLAIAGGTVKIQQGYFLNASQSLIADIQGGEAQISGLLLPVAATHFRVGADVKNVRLTGNMTTPNGPMEVGDDVLTIHNQAEDRLILRSNLYK